MILGTAISSQAINSEPLNNKQNEYGFIREKVSDPAQPVSSHWSR
jgi:hypothetical protein